MQNELPPTWTWEPIRNIATPVRRPVILEDDKPYRTMGVKWWGEGAYERETKFGHEIKAEKLFRVCVNDLIINRIWVRHGSSGLIAETLDGCVVTQDFPTFQLNLSRVTTTWLRYMFKTKWFWEECENKSRGTSGRQRINPDEYLDIAIPLPPLAEQRRIAAKLDALAVRVGLALELQEEAIKVREQWFMASMKAIFEELVADYGQQPLKSMFAFRYELIRPQDKMRGGMKFIGLQHIEPNTGRRIGEDAVQVEELKGRKFRFSPGEIVYGYLRPYLNKVWIADCEGLCSVDQYVLRADKSQVKTEYLAYAMRSPLFLEQSAEKTGLLTLPRLRSGLLEEIKIPLPPLDKQACIVAHLDELQTKMGALKRMQIAAHRELEAMMPSVLDKAFRGEM